MLGEKCQYFCFRGYRVSGQKSAQSAAVNSVTVQSGKTLRFVILGSLSFSALQICYNPDDNGLDLHNPGIAGIEVVTTALVLTEHSENNE